MNNRKLAALLKLDRQGIPADGGEAYNRLIFAKSPYLLQHAENPVDWWEWGEDAFAEARRRDLPLFVSIGYATCHWCHVMAAESFSDHAVAAILNASFIPVKVDREERPDIDEFYMTASRALTGSGGWPLNVFVDHEQKPFFAITYLPVKPRHNTPGFTDLLSNIASLWNVKREFLLNNSGEICRSIASLAALPTATGRKLESLAEEAVLHLTGLFDQSFGGFGGAVKFPMPVYLLFLLSRDSSRLPAARSMAFSTLLQMMKGGIHDQLGGGFHRYSVDQKWRIPHFEKMLYDQAMLISAYAEAFAGSQDHEFLETAHKTARFAVNELLNPDGGFAAGLDADSEGEEGRYYIWPYEELAAILAAECKAALPYWGARKEGDLDGCCILHQAVEPLAFAAQQQLSPAELSRIISTATAALLATREQREKPLRDLKVICSWNSLMILALVKLYKVSGVTEWLATAENTARFILANMVDPEGRLVRSWLGTPSSIAAFAEDYATFTLALADLAESSAAPLWREKLVFFITELDRLFVQQSGEVAFCGSDAEALPIPIPAIQDGVLPASVALCARAFIRAGDVSGNSSLSETGRKIIGKYRGIAEKNPAACLSLIMAEEELAKRGNRGD